MIACSSNLVSLCFYQVVFESYFWEYLKKNERKGIKVLEYIPSKVESDWQEKNPHG